MSRRTVVALVSVPLAALCLAALEPDVSSSAPPTCSCHALIKTVGGDIDMICDGDCRNAADPCDLFGWIRPNGDLAVTCACYENPDAPYSCGGRNCEGGYDWAFVAGAWVPVGAWCTTVDCQAHGGCLVIPPPYVAYVSPCSC